MSKILKIFYSSLNCVCIQMTYFLVCWRRQRYRSCRHSLCKTYNSFPAVASVIVIMVLFSCVQRRHYDYTVGNYCIYRLKIEWYANIAPKAISMRQGKGSSGGVVVKLLAWGANGPMFDSRSRRYYFRDWLSPAFKSRHGWNFAISKATLILQTTKRQRNIINTLCI